MFSELFIHDRAREVKFREMASIDIHRKGLHVVHRLCLPWMFAGHPSWLDMVGELFPKHILEKGLTL